MTSILALLSAALVFFVTTQIVQGAALGSRSVTLSDTKVDATSSYEVALEYTSGTLLGSLELEFCANDPFVGTACTIPTGFDASLALLSSQTGETGFTIDASSNANRILLTRTPAVPGATPSPATYQFDDIVNPDTTGTYYVRVASYATADGTGVITDEGGLAFSIVDAFSVTAFVPPFLDFCVGITITGTDCSTSSGTNLNLGELESSSPSTTISRFRAATNGGGGYTISVLGNTMTAGNNTISRLTTPSTSNTGVPQFGFNLRNNSSPNVGADVAGSGTGSPTTNYGQINQFMFGPGDTIATSPLPTDYSTFTVSYLVNVAESQPVGVYSTTLTFVCLAAF